MREFCAKANWVGVALFALIGLFLLGGGGYLAALGGSLYYVLAGAVFLLVALLMARRDSRAALVYFVFVIATFLWALSEVGWSPWELLPRIMMPAGLALWFILPLKHDARGPALASARWRLGIAAMGPVLVLTALAMVYGSYQAGKFEPGAAALDRVASAPEQAGQWLNYGNSLKGDRFSGAGQITPANVSSLKPAWQFRTGSEGLSFEATPLKVGDNLYLCTSINEVISLDAENGRELWRYNPGAAKAGPTNVCRGVSYYAGGGTDAFCDRRIVTATIDDRLITLDLATGKPCPSFGKGGIVDLSDGKDWDTPGHTYVTSPPLVLGDNAIVGGFVYDNQSTKAPPGVVRAYDIRTGTLKWAWEGISPFSRGPLAPGEHYTPATPNAWGVFSADPELGLIYLPMGNPNPDYFGGNRPPASDLYGSGIVALEAGTGNVRWNFKMMHHDLWDMDVAAQPILADIPAPGGVQKALISTSKRGEIWVLDRVTGKSIIPIEERPVTQKGAVPGERLSPTQPYPVNFPSFAPPRLRESDMWGATFLDQMLCRITFKQRLYDGHFTPPSLQGSIGYPDIFGVFNWGGGSYDPTRQVLVVNASYLPYLSGMIPRNDADASGITLYNRKPDVAPTAPMPDGWLYPQQGTPYAATSTPWTSALGLPCNAPPWGELAAIDIRARKVLWRQPFGTTRDTAPLGLALPTGVFSAGGAVVTQSGLTFIAAAMDDYIRAYDTATGRLLWEQRLPAGGQASPMTYVSTKSGRQFVVIAAGGHKLMGSRTGDYLAAYALPRPR